jgi:predicted RecB family nuclease
MTTTITSDLVEAYALCPRKAFLLMTGVAMNPGPHDYESVIRAESEANRHAHRSSLVQAGRVVALGSPTDLAAGHDVLADADLTTGTLQARADFLVRTDEHTRLGHYGYEPVRVSGTFAASRADAIGCAYQGLVLGELQGRLPSAATLVRLGGRPRKMQLTSRYKAVRRIVDVLRTWAGHPTDDVPPVFLNKHCPGCPFRDVCLTQAEKEDNLSLLDRMTSRLMRKYHDKGIFTVRQLSHIYRPRRSRRMVRRQVRHSLELQALAIRTGKIHVAHLPELPRGPVELVIDLEGIPDRGEYYLAGLLVCKRGEAEYLSFWADAPAGEASMWSALVERLEAYPDSPVFHYGSYEKKAFVTLAKRHGRGSRLADRLINVASFVYGRVYFPVRSNGLKPLGRFLGAAWSDPQASGLQSLVWRHHWGATRDERHKQSLLRYNREDCEAVRVLVARLARIKESAASDPGVELAHRPKQTTSEIGGEVHQQFEQILRNAREGGPSGSVRIRAGDAAAEPKKRGAREGHQTYHRIIPSKVGRVVRVAAKRRCPRGHGELTLDDQGQAERIVIDLNFTRSGCRKTTTRYTGNKGYCPRCHRHYDPPALKRLGNQVFGHAFQAWTVYQRVILRLPYRIITQATEHLFGVGLSHATPVKFLKHMAGYYAETESALLRAIRESPFVHVDETRINIEGVDHYAWVFTDGRHVAFRMTETREADIVREVLTGYEGVLVSDFYPGYDGVPCRQQKCLVHLIRDINDDLWKSPFDRELETFAVEVQRLLVPILQAVDRFGLKVWHLRKFAKDVERFYQRYITGKDYTSEATAAFRKRFDRYRESLFMFLSADGIPWENNMAERAIRQLAVQRKISGSFFKRSAGHYLLLLAISQTCRFQGKSFLNFLLSKGTDVDAFRRTRPIQHSYAVDGQRITPEPSSGRPESGSIGPAAGRPEK